jgi:hypothetical protein
MRRQLPLKVNVVGSPFGKYANKNSPFSQLAKENKASQGAYWLILRLEVPVVLIDCAQVLQLWDTLVG